MVWGVVSLSRSAAGGAKDSARDGGSGREREAEGRSPAGRAAKREEQGHHRDPEGGAEDELERGGQVAGRHEAFDEAGDDEDGGGAHEQLQRLAGGAGG